MQEIGFISGAGDDEEKPDPDECVPEDKGDSVIGDQSTFVENFIQGYEGLIASTVYVMERLANTAK